MNVPTTDILKLPKGNFKNEKVALQIVKKVQPDTVKKYFILDNSKYRQHTA